MERVPSPVAVVSPFRGILALIQSPVCDIPDVVNVSSDLSPPPPRLHPFFLPRQPAPVLVQTETHEMRFYALARQPVVPATSSPPLPSRRAAGRLRLRVSTPVLPPQAVRTASPPRRNHHRPFMSPIQYPDIAGLAISTPPRVGSSQLEPRLLFPNSPLPSPVHVADKSPDLRIVAHMSSPQPLLHGRRTFDAAVQTDPHTDVPVQTSPEPLTLQDLRRELQDLRNELRTFVMAFGF